MKKSGLVLFWVVLLSGLLTITTLAVTQNTSVFYMNGVPIQLESCNINGSNYVKLRDIGKAVNFNVFWDNGVQIDTFSEYTGEKQSDYLKIPSNEKISFTISAMDIKNGILTFSLINHTDTNLFCGKEIWIEKLNAEGDWKCLNQSNAVLTTKFFFNAHDQKEEVLNPDILAQLAPGMYRFSKYVYDDTSGYYITCPCYISR